MSKLKYYFLLLMAFIIPGLKAIPENKDACEVVSTIKKDEQADSHTEDKPIINISSVETRVSGATGSAYAVGLSEIINVGDKVNLNK